MAQPRHRTAGRRREGGVEEDREEEEEVGVLNARDYYFAASVNRSNRFDMDVNIASERVEISKKSVAGKSRDTASDQLGHFGLIDTENIRDLILAQSFPANQLGDLFRQFSSHQ
jgi:hypothetical protein